MYGIWFSSHSTGMWVMTSIGDMSPARMQILRQHWLVSVLWMHSGYNLWHLHVYICAACK